MTDTPDHPPAPQDPPAAPPLLAADAASALPAPRPDPARPLFAQVAVDVPMNSPQTHTGELSYRVPRPLAAHIQIGSRVTVPLGRGNRPTPATVLALTDQTPVIPAPPPKPPEPDADAELFAEPPPPEPQLKEILGVERDILPVPADLIELARWMSVYYSAPIGLTLATMVPAAVKRATRIPAEVLVSLTDVGKRFADVLKMVKTGVAGAGKWSNGAGSVCVRGVSPVCEARVGSGGEVEVPKLSPKARATFMAVADLLADAPRTEAELLAAAQISRVTLRRFVDKNLLKLERRLRAPAAAASASAAPLTLSADQLTAFGDLLPLLRRPQFAVRLIYGVTGSGKTELYIRAIEQVVAAGKRAIVLVPEISLTPQTVRRFTQRFERVAVLHSGLKDSQRHQHWHAIASGWAQVIVGARSAVFAPAGDVGLIVVDEEHDPSYKQDNTPRYHGRDVAIRRAQMLGVPILLGSATPALESWHNAHTNKHWSLLKLTTRPLGMQMPRVLVVDMKGESKQRRGLHILSTVLEHQLRQVLEKNKQAIFLLNRRGYAHYVLCPRCDWVLMCENCDATMVVHRTKAKVERNDGTDTFAERYGRVQCHYCLTNMLLPVMCPQCQARLTHLGQGTQRAEDELLRKFPAIRLARMDSDSMRDSADYQKTLAAFGAGELDLLIGTQMIAKGLDFPNVQLVGVLNADLAMTVPDFRAAERTFQLICQVAGRAGRVGAEERGNVVVQTFQPHEPAISHACNHDYLGFVQNEMPHRAQFGYPPFGRMVRIVLAHKGFTRVEQEAEALARLIEALAAKYSLPVRWHGPQPPPMERLVELYRKEILLFADSAGPLQRMLAMLRARGALSTGNVAISVDVDPVSMM